MSQREHLRAARFWIAVVMAGLFISGVTAFPLKTEVHWLHTQLQTDPLRSVAEKMGLRSWITRVHTALSDAGAHYPFLAYGTDWLAFAHLVLAVAFVGPYRDPVRNSWIITLGLIACAGVIPLALIAGHFRQIPVAWRLVDCSFGVFCSMPLLRCKHHIDALAGPAYAFAHRR